VAYYPDEVIEQIGGGHTILSWLSRYSFDTHPGRHQALAATSTVTNEDCWDKAPINPFRVLEFDDLPEGRCTEMTQVQEKSLFSVLLTPTRRPNA